MRLEGVCSGHSRGGDGFDGSVEGRDVGGSCGSDSVGDGERVGLRGRKISGVVVLTTTCCPFKKFAQSCIDVIIEC